VDVFFVTTGALVVELVKYVSIIQIKEANLFDTVLLTGNVAHIFPVIKGFISQMINFFKVVSLDFQWLVWLFSLQVHNQNLLISIADEILPVSIKS
jgi:hypothetical protein